MPEAWWPRGWPVAIGLLAVAVGVLLLLMRPHLSEDSSRVVLAGPDPAPTSSRGGHLGERLRGVSERECEFSGVVLDSALEEPIPGLRLQLGGRTPIDFQIETGEGGQFAGTLPCDEPLRFFVVPSQGYLPGLVRSDEGEWLAQQAWQIRLKVRSAGGEAVAGAWFDPLGARPRIEVPPEGLELNAEVAGGLTPGRVGAPGYATRQYFVGEEDRLVEESDNRHLVTVKLERLDAARPIHEWAHPSVQGINCLSDGDYTRCTRGDTGWECACPAPAVLGLFSTDSIVGFAADLLSWEDSLPETPRPVEVCLENPSTETVEVSLSGPPGFEHDQRMGAKLSVPPTGTCVDIFAGVRVTVLVGTPPGASTELETREGLVFVLPTSG